MVDWNSAATLAFQGDALHKIDLVMLGMYSWETFSTGWFDFEFLLRKRTFKYPVLVYWLSKYSVLWFIVGVNVTFQVTHRIGCQAISFFIDLSNRAGIAAASNLLLLRTLALWEQDRRVLYPMAVLSLGQWALLLHNVFIVKESWSDAQQTCVVQSVGDGYVKAQFIYTMLFDLIVLVLALRALLKLPGRSSLWKLLFLDGFLYFLIAFTCYLAATIMAFLDLNPIMLFMVSDPATILAATAANRSFVRVHTWSGNDDKARPPVVASGSGGIGVVSGTMSPTSRRHRDRPSMIVRVPGSRQPSSPIFDDAVRVQMETITSVSYPPPGSRSPSDIGKSPEWFEDEETSDLEAQSETVGRDHAIRVSPPVDTDLASTERAGYRYAFNGKAQAL